MQSEMTTSSPRELLEYIRLSLPSERILVFGEEGWRKLLVSLRVDTTLRIDDILVYLDSRRMPGVRCGLEAGVPVLIISRKRCLRSRRKLRL